MDTPAEGGHADTYQWLFRALGGFLDSQPSCRITVAETPTGFLVRLQRALHSLEPEIHMFDRDTLRERLDALFKQHKPALRPRHQGVWSNFPNGHADFFRALGYELDQEGAQDVLVEELEDGVVVTYWKPDGAASKKQIDFLGIADIEKLLNLAFERRAPPQQPQ